MSPNYLLLKNQSRLGFSPLSYWVYDIREVRDQLKDQDYDLVELNFHGLFKLIAVSF